MHYSTFAWSHASKAKKFMSKMYFKASFLQVSNIMDPVATVVNANTSTNKVGSTLMKFIQGLTISSLKAHFD